MAKVFQVDTGGTLLTGLEAYYKLADVNDYQGSANMTNNGVATFAAGKVGNGVNLVRASSQFLSVVNKLNYTGGAYTIAGWFKPASQPSSGQFYSLFAVFEAATDTGLSIAYHNDGGTMKVQGVRTRHNIVDSGPDTAQTLTTGTWYQVVITYDATNVRTYVNGSLLGGPTAASGNGNAGTSDGAYIGNFFAEVSSFYANGMLDEVGFWSKALSAQEITDLYNGGAGQTMIQGATLSESISITESFLKLPARAFSEAISVSDILAKLPGRILTQSITVADSILRVLQRALSESEAVSDSITKLRIVPYLGAESLTVSDSLVKQTGRPLTESITITEVFQRVMSRVFGEAFSITDLFSRIQGRLLTETITIVESIRRFLNNLDVRYSRKYPSNPGSYSAKYTKKGPTYEKKYPDPQ
ncbi:MAG TPA: LamG domain-containing protein [Thermoanaerobaculia bacterium]|jgi:hypothetical protein